MSLIHFCVPITQLPNSTRKCYFHFVYVCIQRYFMHKEIHIFLFYKKSTICIVHYHNTNFSASCNFFTTYLGYYSIAVHKERSISFFLTTAKYFHNIVYHNIFIQSPIYRHLELFPTFCSYSDRMNNFVPSLFHLWVFLQDKF